MFCRNYVQPCRNNPHKKNEKQVLKVWIIMPDYIDHTPINRFELKHKQYL